MAVHIPQGNLNALSHVGFLQLSCFEMRRNGQENAYRQFRLEATMITSLIEFAMIGGTSDALVEVERAHQIYLNLLQEFEVELGDT